MGDGGPDDGLAALEPGRLPSVNPTGPAKPIRWTPHALAALADRGIDRVEAERTVAAPEHVVPAGVSRQVYMRRYFDVLLGQEMLLRVVVEEMSAERSVVTIYWSLLWTWSARSMKTQPLKPPTTVTDERTRIAPSPLPLGEGAWLRVRPARQVSACATLVRPLWCRRSVRTSHGRGGVDAVGPASA
jgi:hypothetical protein